MRNKQETELCRRGARRIRGSEEGLGVSTLVVDADGTKLHSVAELRCGGGIDRSKFLACATPAEAARGELGMDSPRSVSGGRNVVASLLPAAGHGRNRISCATCIFHT